MEIGPDLFIILLIAVFLMRSSNAQCNETDTWMRESTLDEKGDVVIRWNFTDNDVTMVMMGKTKGYIGVGFNTARQLKGADIVIGWVSDGKPHLQDRFSADGGEPIVDEEQSYKLIGGNENFTHTVVCFTRDINTSDQQDLPFTAGTISVIWAISESDPETENINFLSTKTGYKFVHVLTFIYPKPTQSDLEEFEIRLKNNVSVTAEGDNTLYLCTDLKFPPFKEQRYLVGLEVMIPKNNTDYVHHTMLYLCEPKAASKVYAIRNSTGYNCGTSKFRNPCNTVLLVWSMGLDVQYLPPKIGIPFGNTTSEFYLRYEVHYNFTPDKQGFSDNTWMRLLLTKQRPPFEAGVMTTGVQISPIQLIPPRQKQFSTIGICAEKCLAHMSPNEGYINITAMHFHAHKSARKMILRVLRNGKQVDGLVDENFHSNFQDYMFLAKDVHIRSTDTVISECIYNTEDRNRTTIGTLPADQEMCVFNFIYFPKVNLTWCLSFTDKERIFNLTGIQEVGKSVELEGCKGSECDSSISHHGIENSNIIIKPEEYANTTLANYMMNFTNWTPKKIDELKEIYNGPQTQVCLAG